MCFHTHAHVYVCFNRKIAHHGQHRASTAESSLRKEHGVAMMLEMRDFPIKGHMEPKNEPIAPSDTAALIEKAIAAIPTLTRYGVGLYKPPEPPVTRREAIAAGQAELRSVANDVEHCVAWLSHIRPTKTVQPDHTSYSYKHYVESWLEKQGIHEHIWNGALIAAAVGLGYPFKVERWGFGPNVLFGFSRKDVDQTGPHGG